MKNQLLLVKTIANWADEMDLSGFAIFTQEEWARYQATVKMFFKHEPERPVRNGIGSNQDMHYDSIKDYNKTVKVSPLPEKEAKYLMKTFNLKINDGAKPNNFSFSHFGVFTLIDKVHMEESIYNNASRKESVKFLLQNGDRFWAEIIKEDEKNIA